MDHAWVTDDIRSSNTNPEGTARDGSILEEDMDKMDSVLTRQEANSVVLCADIEGTSEILLLIY